MIEHDTVKLLRECDAGVKMGISSIEEVMDNVTDEVFQKKLTECKNEHIRIEEEIEKLLDEYGDDGKEPAVMAEIMSWLKTNVKIAMDESNATVADLITDGCNMGVKSLNKYLNKYKAADEVSKDITKRLIRLEDELSEDIRCYL